MGFIPVIPSATIAAGIASLRAHQTKTLITASLNGFSGTIEKVSAAGLERKEAALAVLKPLQNQIDFVDDPAITYPEITLTVVVSKNDAFLAEAQALFHQHRNNPAAAGPLTIRSHSDDGRVLKTIVFTQAVIQKVRFTEGDTGSHSEALAEILVQPKGIG
jgi:hypothetical protein